MSLESFNHKLSNTEHSGSEVDLSSSKESLSDDRCYHEEKEGFVRLARRRANREIKYKPTSKRAISNSKAQGRPLSKETRVKLTLVPTLGILYSILVSDTMRKPLSILKYSNEKEAVIDTNHELSTKNIVSGFSSLLNVQTARFHDDPSVQPNRNALIPEFSTIDEAVATLFGVNDYSLIRVTRAAATEVGGSVLLKIETALPGHLYLNDDEDENFETVEMNKDYYHELIGSIGDRPTTTFLKKRVARPRYKSDMRVYLIPKSLPCAIYCEARMFKRDLLRGFLNMNNVNRSVIISFDYEEMLNELVEQGHSNLVKEMGLPSADEVKNLQESVKASLSTLFHTELPTHSIQYSQPQMEYTNTSPTPSFLSYTQPSAGLDGQFPYSHENTRYTYLNPSERVPTQQSTQALMHQIQGNFMVNQQNIPYQSEQFSIGGTMNPASFDSINPPQLQQTQFGLDQTRRYGDINFNSQGQQQHVNYQTGFTQVRLNGILGQVNGQPNGIWNSTSGYSNNYTNTLYQQI